MVKSILCGWFVWISASLHAQLADFTTPFEKADSVAQAHAHRSLQNIPLLAFYLTYSLPTELEKFRAIYKWVCTNIQSDYRLYMTNQSNQKKWANKPAKLADWNRSFSRDVFKKLLREQKTVCTGYAYLVCELARHCRLPCKIINGYAHTNDCDFNPKSVANHSWNIIQLNGKWYSCDPTWSSGTVNIATGDFQPNYNNKYFLTDSSLFNSHHNAFDTLSFQHKKAEKNLP
ncbi:MAG: transglutaminase domain-containing protein [Flammeovirgaceae bacterium]